VIPHPAVQRYYTREKPGLERSLARNALREGAHMEIGVIGAGNVGGTLGRRWAQAGHTVLFVV
jgi:phosphoglycerate dehydrogenase-like enzyme